MDFSPDADQKALATATREFIESRFPLADCAPQLDDTRWQELAELGWLGIAADTQVGGAGATLVDEVFVFCEIGHGLVTGPVLATLAAARLASWVGDRALAADLVAGRLRVSHAVALPGDDGRLLLIYPQASSLILHVSHGGAALYATPDNVVLTAGLEDAMMLGRCTLDVLGTAVLESQDVRIVARLRRVLSILTSAQLVGIAEATRDLATAQAKNRVQFGKPIGAFQAIKHQCADMAVGAMAAKNVTLFAALTEVPTPSGSDYNALAAAAFCSRAALANARANVHIHGAMGFTVENSAHRFVKRTHTLCSVESFGRVAAELGSYPRPTSKKEI